MQIGNILAIAVLILGFGFVVFFHELGHFLAAKWMGIKVEQFAVGFGHAVLAWRKGMGFRVGTTTPEYDRRIKDQLQEKGITSDATPQQVVRASSDLGISETEYRLNWLPLGGYVKMLGQDDMNPNAQSDDPRAFNRQSIGARMVVVSAGVIMNVILATLLFMGLFLAGFHVPPAIVGSIQTNSPAQLAGLQPGDRIVKFDGWVMHDFTKLQLSTALVHAGEPVQIEIERNGVIQKPLEITAGRAISDKKAFYALGVGPVFNLEGITPKTADQLKDAGLPPLDEKHDLQPGDKIVAVGAGGERVAVRPEDYAIFARALQNSEGRSVSLEVVDAQGRQRTVEAQPRFQAFFGDAPFTVAGLLPLARIETIMPKSPGRGKLEFGDVICAVKIGDTITHYPPESEVRSLIAKAGADSGAVEFKVQRAGQQQWLPAIPANLRTGESKWGIGLGLIVDDQTPITAAPLPESSAFNAKIPAGALIQQINGQEAKTWFDVLRLLRQEAAENKAVKLAYVQLDAGSGQPVAGSQKTVDLTVSAPELRTLANIRFTHDLLLNERIVIRRTGNPLQAAWWGVTETRDLLLSFYITLQRLFQGSVSATNFMGPLGIAHAGSFFAFKGWDWLTWFLAMISANLAVVNFLPIPIVDGGLFMFLIIEKIQGKPLSARMQTIAQIVGLAIILSVFLLVTYQDIRRIWL